MVDPTLELDNGQHLTTPGESMTNAANVLDLGAYAIVQAALQFDVSASLETPSFYPPACHYDPSTGIWSGLDLDAGMVAELFPGAECGAHPGENPVSFELGEISGSTHGEWQELPIGSTDTLVAGAVWVYFTVDAAGAQSFEVSFDALQAYPVLFHDGFEPSDFTRWSIATP